MWWTILLIASSNLDFLVLLRVLPAWIGSGPSQELGAAMAFIEILLCSLQDTTVKLQSCIQNLQVQPASASPALSQPRAATPLSPPSRIFSSLFSFRKAEKSSYHRDTSPRLQFDAKSCQSLESCVKAASKVWTPAQPIASASLSPHPEASYQVPGYHCCDPAYCSALTYQNPRGPAAISCSKGPPDSGSLRLFSPVIFHCPLSTVHILLSLGL